MTTVFWNRKGLLMVEFVQQGAAITSEVYFETLKTAEVHSNQKTQNADIQCSALL
jgi:hypothetical protein